MAEYISISEFARRAGVSRQAIQQRLDTSLREYVKVEQGKKTINIKGLELFRGARLAQDDSNLPQGLIDTLQQTIHTLQGQLEVKDHQIEILSAALDSTTKALHAAQALHAGTMVQQLGPGSDQIQEPVIDVDAPAATSEPAEPEAQEPTQQPRPRRHWWQRRKGT